MRAVGSIGILLPCPFRHNGMTATRLAAASRSRAEAGLPVRVAQPLRASAAQASSTGRVATDCCRHAPSGQDNSFTRHRSADRRTIPLTLRQSARARSSTAAPRPQNLTSGRRASRLAPKSLILEVVGLGRAEPIFIAASCSQDVMRSARRDPGKGQLPSRMAGTP